MLILCIILPPIAAGISGGFFSFLINLVLTCIGWFPGVIHAYMVTKNARSEEKHEELIATLKQGESSHYLKQKSIFNNFVAGVAFVLIIYSIYYFYKVFPLPEYFLWVDQTVDQNVPVDIESATTNLK